MKPTLEELTSSALEQKLTRSLDRMVLRYAILKTQIGMGDQQSWYFKTALESHIEKLAELKDEYDDYKNFVNSRTEADILQEIVRETARLQERVDRPKVNFVSYHHIGHLRSSIAKLEERLDIKRQVCFLNEIDFYVDDKDLLFKLFNINPCNSPTDV